MKIETAIVEGSRNVVKMYETTGKEKKALQEVMKNVFLRFNAVDTVSFNKKCEFSFNGLL